MGRTLFTQLHLRGGTASAMMSAIGEGMENMAGNAGISVSLGKSATISRAGCVMLSAAQMIG